MRAAEKQFHRADRRGQAAASFCRKLGGISHFRVALIDLGAGRHLGHEFQDGGRNGEGRGRVLGGIADGAARLRLPPACCAAVAAPPTEQASPLRARVWLVMRGSGRSHLFDEDSLIFCLLGSPLQQARAEDTLKVGSWSVGEYSPAIDGAAVVGDGGVRSLREHAVLTCFRRRS
jgi:hypothetical protein